VGAGKDAVAERTSWLRIAGAYCIMWLSTRRNGAHKLSLKTAAYFNRELFIQIQWAFKLSRRKNSDFRERAGLMYLWS